MSLTDSLSLADAIAEQNPRDLGTRLKNYRERAALTREEVAVKIGRGVGSIRDYELGQRPPNGVLISKLARVYGVTASELIGIAA